MVTLLLPTPTLTLQLLTPVVVLVVTPGFPPAAVHTAGRAPWPLQGEGARRGLEEPDIWVLDLPKEGEAIGSQRKENGSPDIWVLDWEGRR